MGTISMNNHNTIVTVAMLSAFLSYDKKDYIALIKPFVLKLLPRHEGDVVDIIDMQKSLSTDFGLVDFPIHLLKSILTRCSKSKDGYLRRTNSNYYVKTVYDDSDFNTKQAKIQAGTDSVLAELQKYLNELTTIKCKDKNDAKRRLILFLNTYGYLLVYDIEELREIKNNIDQNNYHIARFILAQRNINSVIFSEIMEIVKGYLVYKAIYFFSTEQKIDVRSKMKDTIFIFDTRLLISALGYNRQEDTKACRELIDLIYENNGQVKTFPHMIEEIYGILTKFAHDKESRNSFDLETLIVNKYEKVDILRLRDTLEINLQQLKIEVVELPSYGNVSSEDKDIKDRGFIGLEEFKQDLILVYKEAGKYPKDNPLIHDIESISAISRMRGRERPCTLENCKAIFVTTNQIIVRTVQDHFKDRWNKREIPFSISEMELTAVIWLKSYDKKTELPCLMLIQNAYAACTPSKALLSALSDKIKMLEIEGTISSEAALILRSQRELDGELLELTENNPSKVTNEVIFKIKNKYDESIIDAEKDKLSTISSEQEKEIKKQARKELKAKAIEIAEHDAFIESKKYLKRLVRCQKIINLFIIIVFVISSLSTLYANISTKNNIWLILTLPSLAITILSGIFFVKSDLFSKSQEKRANMMFDQKRDNKVREIDRLYSDGE